MRAFICDGCKAQHDYENLSISTVCDKCKQVMTTSVYRCVMCNGDDNNWGNTPDYHKTCLIKYNKEYYCDTHKIKRQKQEEAAKVIESYAINFWGELGGAISNFKRDEDNKRYREFIVDFPSLRLEVQMVTAGKGSIAEADMDDFDESEQEIVAINYGVFGIKKFGKSLFEAPIHNHDHTLEEVASAILRSLRSKKSVMTVEKKDSDFWKYATRSEKIEFNKKRKGIVEAAAFMKDKLTEIKAARKAKLVAEPV